ncbi:MAG TPA: ferric reductase-like transmembrane domain-containing protein [Acidimicrobiales bacterium]|nr:ferric reductase-like transmembrane domain-containing protein [Acidimicrobiales bacterium]
MNPQTWWYLARGSGIVAWALLVMSLVWGVLLSTRALRPRDRPAWLADLHRWLGGLATTAVGLHLAALVADSYVELGPADLLVPLASSWRPVPVALGVLALYGLVAVEATSLAMRRLPRRAWRGVHLLSYGVVWLVSLHAGLAGSDTTNPAYRATAVALTAAAVVAIVLRLVHGPASSRRGPRRPGPRTPPPARAPAPARASVPGRVRTPPGPTTRPPARTSSAGSTRAGAVPSVASGSPVGRSQPS